MYFLHNGTPVYYTKAGEGESLLLLHGWGAQSTVFEALINHYSRVFRVLALDFPPFGLSGALCGDYTVKDYKELVLALLDSEGIRKTDIICHSFGGRVAIKFASENPDRINRLVLCSAAGMPYGFSLKKQLKKVRYKVMKLFTPKGTSGKNKLRRFFSSDYLALPENMRKTFVNITKEVLVKDAGEITAPTLIIWGKDDRETPLYMAKKLNGIIKGSKLQVISGGHFSFLESAADFKAATDGFLGI